MFRSFVLFSLAAAMAAAQGVQAAEDLPAPPPVDFSRLCAAFGAGFHAIPGSETCVRMGGRVRADAVLADGPGASREDNNLTTRSRGTVTFETRTQTDFGLVRTFLEFETDIPPID